MNRQRQSRPIGVPGAARPRLARVTAANALAVGVLAALTGCATGPGPTPDIPIPAGIPAALQVPVGESPFLTVRATGVQIYECASTPTAPAAYAWQFRGPEATLADGAGKTVGRHFAGPSWALEDGSSVVGQAAASAPAPRAGAIAWLLLSVKSHGGSGLLDQAVSVQRLDTLGGAAPTLPCGAQNAQQTERVAYSAVYVFYRR